MRVAILTHMGLPHMGGSEYYAHNLAKSLQAVGADVTIVTSWPGGGVVEGVPYQRFSPGSPYPLKEFLKVFDVRILLGSRNWIYDAAVPFSRPIICIPCGDGPPRHPVDRIVALTKKEQGMYTKAALIPPGIDYSEFLPHKGGGGRYCLYVGGDYPHKRVPLIEQACEIAGLELLRVGNGFHVLSRHDLLESFQQADVLALASNHEGYGIVLLEALAAGVPWVSTDVGVASELPGGVVLGLWPSPEDFALGLKQAIKLVVDQKSAQSYDWSVIGQRWAELLDEVWLGKS